MFSGQDSAVLPLLSVQGFFCVSKELKINLEDGRRVCVASPFLP